MSERGRVTVVIATRNRCDELVRTVARLRALPERPEVIVVDNASTDGTAAAVLSEGDFGVSLIRLDRNLGAAARNLGVQAAKTPYVAFSDDDSWWEPGALEKVAQTFDRHPGLGLIAARALVGPARVADPINAAMASSPLPVGSAGPSVLGFLACASAVRRTAFLQAGGFSSLLFFVGEERLLAYDLAAAGWDRCYVPEVVAVHEPSPRRPAHSRRHRAELRNDLLTTWLRRPLWQALRDTFRLGVAAAKDVDARHALAAALLRLPRALSRRRPLPPDVERAAVFLDNSPVPAEPAQAQEPVGVR